MSKRKKTTPQEAPDNESVTTRAVVSAEVLQQAMGEGSPIGGEGVVGELGHQGELGELATKEVVLEELPAESIEVPMHGEDAPIDAAEGSEDASEGAGSGEVEVEVEPLSFDAEMTVNLVGDLPLPGRDDLDAPTVSASAEALEGIDRLLLQRKHLRGLIESLVFASDSPIKPNELAKLASAPTKQVKELLEELKVDYSTRGIHLDEVAGGWVFRTSPQYAPFVRDLTKQRPVKLTRAQVETLAIIAYRQPMTRPEVDDVRGVDSGPVLKLLLERDLVRILGKRDEPGRPLIYGTTTQFLEFFGLKSLKDLPTLREFTELSDESRETFEEELGESPEDAALRAAEAEIQAAGVAAEGGDSLGEHEPEGEGPDNDGRSVHESMRVAIGEQALDDLGDDESDLEAHEPLDPEDERLIDEALSIDAAENTDFETDPGADDSSPHAADDDGPTLTSEAPKDDD